MFSVWNLKYYFWLPKQKTAQTNTSQPDRLHLLKWFQINILNKILHICFWLQIWGWTTSRDVWQSPLWLNEWITRGERPSLSSRSSLLLPQNRPWRWPSGPCSDPSLSLLHLFRNQTSLILSHKHHEQRPTIPDHHQEACGAFSLWRGHDWAQQTSGSCEVSLWSATRASTKA